MKTTIVICTLLAVVLGIGMFTKHAFACPHHRDKHSDRHSGPGWMQSRHTDCGFSHGKKLMYLATQLDLTEEQSDRVRGIIKSHMSQSIDVMWPMVQARRELKQLMHEEQPDENAIRDAATRMGNAITEATVLKSQLHQQIRETLTPEQLEQLKELRHHHRSKCGKGHQDADNRCPHSGHGEHKPKCDASQR